MPANLKLMMRRWIGPTLVLLITMAAAAEGATTRAVDLAEDATIVAEGGHRVSGAGDVNGEGAPDWIVGNGVQGASYVIFGERAAGNVDLDDLGAMGFEIRGASGQDDATYVAGAGDVNADGLDDLLVGAPRSSPLNRAGAGSAYVVFGKTTTDKVELSNFDLNIQGEAGFRIMGPSSMAFAGEDVSSAGDINQDGYDDVLVGAVFRGATYVVFGKESSVPVDLLAFDMGEQGSQGYVIETPVPENNDLYSVSGGLDLNGDGVPDPTVGVIRRYGGRGSVYVTFGRATSTDPIDVRDLGDKGVTIVGTRGSGSGYGLDQVPDLNGDGRAEVLVGAPGFASAGSRGNAYVVFGRKRSGPVGLARLGRGGFRIDGSHQRATFGTSVASTADVNGEGRAELLIGAPIASPKGRAYAGAAYVVYGKSGTRTVRIKELGTRGIRIAGAGAEHYAGTWVASAGLDPERGATLLVSAPQGGEGFGAVYVVHLRVQ